MISRTEAGKEIQTGLSDYLQTGDYIVPKYGELGAKQGKGKVYGDKADVLSIAQKIAKHALGEAEGTLATVQAPTSKPVKAPKPKAQKRKNPIVEKIVQQPTLKVDTFAEEADEEDKTLSIGEIIQASGGSPKPAKEDSYQTLNVVFANKLGKIKVKVIGILEEESSIALIFKDDNDLTFEPQQGEVLNLILPGDKTYKVMYPGFLYTWIDKTKRIMVVVKTELDEE